MKAGRMFVAMKAWEKKMRMGFKTWVVEIVNPSPRNKTELSSAE